MRPSAHAMGGVLGHVAVEACQGREVCKLRAESVGRGASEPLAARSAPQPIHPAVCESGWSQRPCARGPRRRSIARRNTPRRRSQQVWCRVSDAATDADREAEGAARRGRPERVASGSRGRAAHAEGHVCEWCGGRQWAHGERARGRGVRRGPTSRLAARRRPDECGRLTCARTRKGPPPRQECRLDAQSEGEVCVL